MVVGDLCLIVIKANKGFARFSSFASHSANAVPLRMKRSLQITSFFSVVELITSKIEANRSKTVYFLSLRYERSRVKGGE
ncbi:hypothetical protein AWN68_08310 [Roseivirga echinicomitans]|uniref:Uncharacterized protein n=1 Tax=Roseivirga echinicomitans TaxID=296218 RepID=A0A150X1U4_9BACT|nr:hypothetical protein AWN68_08310 [Roseivirga echinicomitans]